MLQVTEQGEMVHTICRSDLHRVLAYFSTTLSDKELHDVAFLLVILDYAKMNKTVFVDCLLIQLGCNRKQAEQTHTKLITCIEHALEELG